MADIVSTILLGITLIVGIFLILHLVLRMNGKLSASIVALLTVGIYVPYSIFIWPGGDVFAMHIAVFLVTAYMLGIITSYREKRLAEMAEGEKAGWFHWGPALIVGFFLFIVVVDSIFVTMATKGVSGDVASWLLPEPRNAGKVESYFPGTVSHDYQKVQAEYNQYLAQMREQARRGWQIRKGWVQTPYVGEPQVFQVELKDKQGNLLEGADIVGRFLRPSNSSEDVEFSMQETAPGRYQVKTNLHLQGNWDMDMYIRLGEAMHQIQGSTYVEPSR
ncbi:MAG: FixH family protein [Gammaproteobacteria bacterium]|nr:FixH family protein [Gammaproteobacteria bacterium]